MRYARNHYGELVSAEKAGRGGSVRWYSCPTCGQAVFLKSGAVYEAHFAHRANVAKPECELFHPGRDGLSGAPSAQTRPQREVASWSWPALFLAPSATGFDLNILLPLHPSGPTWTGRIIYRDHRGVRYFGSASLQRRTYVHVLPRRDPYSFDKNGDVPVAIWASLRNEAGLGDRNVFYCSEVGGKRLEVNAPMEFGERYWLLMPPGALLDNDVSRMCKAVGAIEGWTVYEVQLPEASIAASWPIVRRECLEDWFHHPFKDPAPKVWIRSPFPLYADGDTWVFPRTKCLEFVVTGFTHEQLTLDHLVSQHQLPLERGTRDGAWIAEDIAAGFYTVRLGHRVAMSFEVRDGSVPLFSPPSLDVVCEDRRYPLFAAAEPLQALRAGRNAQRVTFALPPGMAMGSVLLNGEPWDGTDMAPVLEDPLREFSIEAGSFGVVRLEPEVAQRPANEIDESIVHTARWLLSLPQPRGRVGAVEFPILEGELPELLARLTQRKWSAAFAPHLINLWQKLRGTASL